MRRVYIVDGSEGIVSKARAMAHLTVRNVSGDLVAALERRAEANGRSLEAEHRALLHAALLGANADFAARAAKLRQRLRSSIDSSDIIRALRDGAT